MNLSSVAGDGETGIGDVCASSMPKNGQWFNGEKR